MVISKIFLLRVFPANIYFFYTHFITLKITTFAELLFSEIKALCDTYEF